MRSCHLKKTLSSSQAECHLSISQVLWRQSQENLKFQSSLGNITRFPLKYSKMAVAEMVQELIALSALAEDLGSIPRIYMESQPFVTPVPGDPVPSVGLHVRQTHMWHRHTCRQNTYTDTTICVYVCVYMCMYVYLHVYTNTYIILKSEMGGWRDDSAFRNT